MKYRLFTLVLGIFVTTTIQGQIVDTIGNTTIHIDSLVGFTNTATDWPWDVEWGPDDKLWFTVGTKICRYDTTTHAVDTIYKKSNPLTNSMSLAFHPNFVSQPFVYCTYDIGNYY